MTSENAFDVINEHSGELAPTSHALLVNDACDLNKPQYTTLSIFFRFEGQAVFNYEGGLKLP